jgi:serine/threonine protein kinase/flagellar basal body-associated protein FliL
MALETLQNGRYRILRLLGSGSMGEVYLVEDTRINRQVAIKVIRSESNPYPGSSENLEASRLFEREAKAVARLNHQHILPLYDFGEEKGNDSVLTYMVMPYTPDGSLASWLQQNGYGGTLPPQEVVHFVRQAADALQNAHDNGIIHQDVKPQNFLIRRGNANQIPDLLLADFGIAKLSVGTAGASQVIRGTPLYMAPEQWEGNPVPASDQYSLAIMAYQLLTGKTPFQGGPSQMMYQHFNVSPLPPSAVNPSLSPDIDTVLLRAMAKRPEARFPTIAAFADAFEEAISAGGPTSVPSQGLAPGRSGITPSQTFQPQDTLRAALAISDAEAYSGTVRTLTLANGHRISVDIPAGVQNGQLLQIQGRDLTPGGTGAFIPLLLAITTSPAIAPGASGYLTGESTGIMAASDQMLMPGTVNGRTQIGNMSTIYSPIDQSPRNTPVVPPAYPPSFGGSGPGQQHGPIRSDPNQKKPSRGTAILILAIVLLLIVASVAGAIFYIAGNDARANSAKATATAVAINNQNGTTTAQNNATSTTVQSNLNATSTAQSNNATATSQNANATATAQSNSATATAQNANATATAQSATATATAAVTPTTFSVQSVNLTVSPASISGIACGTTITVTYTATFTIPTKTPGGTIQFTYTTDNGASDQNGSVTVAQGATTQTFAFTWTGALPADHTEPGIGIVQTTSPNQVTSNQAQPTGQCT